MLQNGRLPDIEMACIHLAAKVAPKTLFIQARDERQLVGFIDCLDPFQHPDHGEFCYDYEGGKLAYNHYKA
jgi:hypothetical protein